MNRYTLILAFILVSGFILTSASLLLKESRKYEKVEIVKLRADSPPNVAVLFDVVDPVKNLYRLNVTAKFGKLPQTIELLLATASASPRVVEAKIYSPSGDCVWEGDHGSIIADNSLFAFEKKSCTASTLSNLTVDVVTKTPVALHIWSAESSDGALQLNGHEKKRFAIGNIEVPIQAKAARIIDLLSYMWDEAGPERVKLLLFTGLLFAGIGTFLLVFLRARFLPLTLTATWFGFSLFYCIIIPPFHAPDEPDHLLSFASNFSDSGFENSLLKLANKGHFNRILFHPDQKFTASHLGQPLNEAWPSHINAEYVRNRSRITAFLWERLGLMISGLQTAERVFAIRLFNVLFVGLTLVFAVTLHRTYQRNIDRGFVFLLLSVPALFSFASHVSNYFTSIAAYLIVGIAVARAFHWRYFSSRAWLLFGLAVGAMPFTNAGGSGTIVLWAPLAACLVLDGTGFKRPKETLLNFLAFSLPIIAFQIFFNSQLISDFYGAILNTGIASAIPQYMSLQSLSLIFLLLPCVFLLKGADKLTRSNSADFTTKILRNGMLTAVGVFVVYVCLQSLIEGFKLEPSDIEATRPTTHVKNTIKNIVSFWVGLLPGHPNFYMSSSFWFGFGWLEKMPHSWIVALTRSFAGLAFVMGVVHTLVRPKDFRLLRLWSVLIGISLFIGGMGYQLSKMFVNLHGRYLILPYILVLSVGACGLQFLFLWLSKNIRRILLRRSYALTALTIILGVHTYSIFFVIQRYF